MSDTSRSEGRERVAETPGTGTVHTGDSGDARGLKHNDVIREGVNLSDDEATALAHLIVARHLDNADWLEWEDYPELGQYAFERLVEAVKYLGVHHSRVARSWGLVGIDAHALLERAL